MSSRIMLAEMAATFHADDGSLPNGVVVGCSRSDRPKVVTAFAGMGWRMAWTSDGRPVLATDVNDPEHEAEGFGVRPVDGVLINVFDWGEVGFDFDRRELVDEDAVDALCAVIRLLGVTLERRVELTYEGSDDQVFGHFDPTTGDFSIVGRDTQSD